MRAPHAGVPGTSPARSATPVDVRRRAAGSRRPRSGSARARSSRRHARRDRGRSHRFGVVSSPEGCIRRPSPARGTWTKRCPRLGHARGHDHHHRTGLVRRRAAPQTRPGRPRGDGPTPHRRRSISHREQTSAGVVLHVVVPRPPLRRGGRRWSAHGCVRPSPARCVVVVVAPTARHGVGARDGLAPPEASRGPSRVGPRRAERPGFDMGGRSSRRPGSGGRRGANFRRRGDPRRLGEGCGHSP